MLREALAALAPRAGETAVDCTLGRAGHAVELLRQVGPTGKLMGIDCDGENLAAARERLARLGENFTIHHGNFAALAQIVACQSPDGVDMVLADLGMSSMQVDAADRGFSYVRDGPLDMRMDRSRGRTAAQILATISAADLADALTTFGDEPHAERIAAAIVEARGQKPLDRTSDLIDMVGRALQVAVTRDSGWRLHTGRGRWQSHSAARTFQAVRMLVNRELASLQELLRVLPACLRPGGRAAIISFHSGEDRLVKTAFRDGLNRGWYEAGCEQPVRPSGAEKLANPRSRSAKLRWAMRPRAIARGSD
jgi:16S rRNA (cytosine1402-N4)-methyltransferase